MHYSLVLVGAHDGSKTESYVLEYAKRGKVLLVEPVPWLYQQLLKRFNGVHNVAIGNFVVSDTDGIVDFCAPLENANAVFPVADQLGSLNPGHASAHCSDLKNVIKKTAALAKSFKTLIQEYGIGSIELLHTDTEGYDAKILQKFPFNKMVPEKILFEHKHSDGPFHIGRNFGALVVLLDVVGYNVRFFDVENCLAEYKQSGN